MIPTHRPDVGSLELDAVRAVLESRWLGPGEVVRQFEDAVARICGSKHVVAVHTCTVALQLAFQALGIQAGDEIIVPAMTYCGAIQSILNAGAKPVFCEVSPDSLNLDLEDALCRVTPRTRGIVPVHYGGEPCDMDALGKEGRRRGLWVVDDAAHAFGSSYRGRPVGTLADATCFSFDAIKNLTCGDGGAIATDDDALAARLRTMRQCGMSQDTWQRVDHKRSWEFDVVSTGLRCHMNNLSAALGLAQLKRFDFFRDRRRELVRRYDAALGKLSGIQLLAHHPSETFPFSYVIRVLDGRRDRLAEHLFRRNIRTSVQFIPNHLHSAFAAFRTPLPVTESLYEEILKLPFYTEMTDAQQDEVIESIHAFFGAGNQPVPVRRAA